MYDWLKAIHILMAIIWVGGGFTTQFLVSRLRSEPVRMVKTAKDVEWMGNHIFLPASLVLLAMGLWMVFGFELWEITDTWVLIGLGGIVATIITGAGYLGPSIKKINAMVDERGVEDPEVAAKIERLFVISRIDLAVLTLVVLDMAIKPGCC